MWEGDAGHADARVRALCSLRVGATVPRRAMKAARRLRFDESAESWSLTGASSVVVADAGEENWEAGQLALNRARDRAGDPRPAAAGLEPRSARRPCDGLAACASAIELVPELIAKHLSLFL